MEQNNINCNVARDLLPLYADGVLSDDSKQLVDAHLIGCQPCKQELEDLRSGSLKPRRSARQGLSRAKKKLRLRIVIAAVLAGALAFGIFIYGANYCPPVPYEEGMIGVGPFSWSENKFTDESDSWYVMRNVRGIRLSASSVYQHINEDGSLQIWLFENFSKVALWDRISAWAHNRRNHAEAPDWTSGTQFYPLDHPAESDTRGIPSEGRNVQVSNGFLYNGKVHATVYWMEDPSLLNRTQVVERETDHLSAEVLARCTLIWDGDIQTADGKLVQPGSERWLPAVTYPSAPKTTKPPKNAEVQTIPATMTSVETTF